MDENLVGYLLRGLDPPAQREVEEYLRGNPDAQVRLELLRRALAPLAEDKDAEAPPAGLRHATLARVAAHRCRDLPHAPMPSRSRATIPVRSWWRVPDALVAAAILLIVVALVPLMRLKVMHQMHLAACQNNLAGYFRALTTYADHHGGRLPQLDPDDPPRNVAGIFVPILQENRLLDRTLSIACPSNGRHAPTGHSVSQLRALYESDPAEFNRQVRFLSGCYAFVLGYHDEAGRFHGLARCGDAQHFPIMADRPPFDQLNPTGLDRHSTNHGGRGQNVLYLDGHVLYATSRFVGPGGDDIFLNRRREINAGIGRDDSVLGASPVRVLPVRFQQP